MKKTFKIITILFFILIFASSTISAKENSRIKFSSTTIDGETVDESIFENSKLTMINIWGTYCGPCISEMPDLAKLNNSFDENDFQVAGIVIDAINNDWQPSKRMCKIANGIVKKTGADYVHIVPSTDMYYTILADVYAVPTTIFVDSEGYIVGEPYVGSRSLKDWLKIVNKLLR